MLGSISKIFDRFYFWQHQTALELKKIFSYPFIKLYATGLVIVMGANFSFAFYIFNQINPESRDLTALHYDVDFGRDLIGHAGRIFILPILGTIFACINFALFATLYRHKSRLFIGHLLFFSAIIANVFLGLGLWSIYLINFK